MAVRTCPCCHERVRYDSRKELEELTIVTADSAADSPDRAPLVYRSEGRVLHSCFTIGPFTSDVRA
jgi:hypothetical protein